MEPNYPTGAVTIFVCNRCRHTHCTITVSGQDPTHPGPVQCPYGCMKHELKEVSYRYINEVRE